MKKLLLSILLMISIDVYADWTFVGGSDNTSHYIDTSTIKKSGNGTYKYWILMEYNDANITSEGKKYRSLVSQSEEDCINQNSRDFYLIAYSDVQGRGEVIGNETATAHWKPIPPNSVGVSEHEFVCNYFKKKKVK